MKISIYMSSLLLWQQISQNEGNNSIQKGHRTYWESILIIVPISFTCFYSMLKFYFLIVNKMEFLCLVIKGISLYRWSHRYITKNNHFSIDTCSMLFSILRPLKIVFVIGGRTAALYGNFFPSAWKSISCLQTPSFLQIPLGNSYVFLQTLQILWRCRQFLHLPLQIQKSTSYWQFPRKFWIANIQLLWKFHVACPLTTDNNYNGQKKAFFIAPTCHLSVLPFLPVNQVPNKYDSKWLNWMK